MKTLLMILTVCMALQTAGADAVDDRAGEGLVRTPQEIEWVASYRVPGLGLARIDGDANRHGTYVYRVRFPAGRIVRPHYHPDERRVTVLSGTWYVGWGDTYDPQGLEALPAGSYYVEPAGVAHYAAAPDGEVELQVTGTGPTAAYYTGRQPSSSGQRAGPVGNPP